MKSPIEVWNFASGRFVGSSANAGEHARVSARILQRKLRMVKKIPPSSVDCVNIISLYTMAQRTMKNESHIAGINIITI